MANFDYCSAVSHRTWNQRFGDYILLFCVRLLNAKVVLQSCIWLLNWFLTLGYEISTKFRPFPHFSHTIVAKDPFLSFWVILPSMNCTQSITACFLSFHFIFFLFIVILKFVSLFKNLILSVVFSSNKFEVPNYEMFDIIIPMKMKLIAFSTFVFFVLDFGRCNGFINF